MATLDDDLQAKSDASGARKNVTGNSYLEVIGVPGAGPIAGG
ncbi:hypothetical protein [Arthrobacter sp. ISL-30]|nr:hypothetical protein [Arthrobacter sp. ISL-30]